MRALYFFSTFCLFVAVANAITCYDCDSLSDPRCNEYFSAEGVQETNCDEAEMPEYLRKYGRRLPATGCLTKFHEGVEGNLYFIRRSCFFGDLEDTREACEAPDSYVFFADVLQCHVCDEDLCNTNAGGRAEPVPVLFVLFLSCALVILKHLC